MKKITRISCIGTPWALGQSTVSPTADESFNVSRMEERHFVHSVSFREALNLDRCGVGSDDWYRKATPEIRVHIAEAAVDPAAAPRTLSLSSSQLGGVGSHAYLHGLATYWASVLTYPLTTAQKILAAAHAHPKSFAIATPDLRDFHS